ncbi:ATP-binding cassette domain-containing protein [Alkalibaculum sp. M08DMB]|uniref:ATP-binding cassette domain-containing protein n=1 Tax=Alkalibaculum sporogenes TaxID=2655001 RepID=A0A6A7KBU6_9FIRM|nr:ABC transporter ATP-binding protein [Alkalibaculum sporogenes]MPW26483.1 ATP-binding cassette domain-containing protein [Alkalibaculum sporogenes]
MEKVDTKTTRTKNGTARLMELAATKKPLMIASVVLSALASIISFVPYISIYYIVGEIMSVYPNFQSLDVHRTIGFGWIAFGGILGNVLFYFFALICSHLAAFGTLYELKVKFAFHLAKLPLGFHLTIGSGKMRKIMDENIEKVEGFIAHQLPDIVAAIVAPIVMVAILLIFDWRFGLAAIVGILVAFGLEFKAYGNAGAKTMMNQYQNAIEDMNNASVEYIRGITVVKAFRQTVYSFRRLHETIKSYTKFVIPYTLSWENYMSGFTTIVNNIYLFLIPVGIFLGLRTTNYESFATTFIFYLIFVPSISSVMMKIMYVSSSGMQIIGGVERMDDILRNEPLAETDTPETCKGHDIVFQDVSFSYDVNKDASALTNVSFHANQGEVTAIVGPSGGGKSTIAHLIPRFFDVTEGSIQIDNVDIRKMNLDYLMKKVSFVFQDVFLFKQSIMDNIRIGNLSATDEEVIAAAEAAQCHEFIKRLPQGYHTVIGTKGVHLSGGEQQRIVIARAIVKNAPIIVLDEATAFTDPENEYLIQKAFEKLMDKKTVIMIAHRLSTIRSANKIIVMDKGVLVEQGSHDELMKKKSKYYDMWEMYTKSLDWKIHSKEEGRINA